MTSLLAEYDHITRLSHILNDGACEPEFFRFVGKAMEFKEKLTSVEKECERLMGEIQRANEIRSTLERKLFTGMQMVEMEKKKRKNVEAKVAELEKGMMKMRKLVCDGRNQLHEDVKGILDHLYTMPKPRSDKDKYNKENIKNIARFKADTTKTELLNASTSCLSDLGYSQSDNDLDTSLRHAHNWQKPKLNSEGPPTKRSLSSFTPQLECLPERASVQSSDNQSSIASCSVLMVDEKSPFYLKDHVDLNTAILECLPSNTSKIINNHEVKISQYSSSEYLPEKILDKKNLMALPLSKSRIYPKKVISKGHSFGQRPIFKTENCNSCGKRLRFGKLAAKCNGCKAIVHFECKERLPLPCIPAALVPIHKRNGSLISDFAPNDPPMVPALIVHCIEEIEARGMIQGVTGIYQSSCDQREVKALKEKFLHGHGIPMLCNVNTSVICGVIEDFLSCLREPIIIPSLWSDFVRCFEESEEKEKENKLHCLLMQLPRPNRDTLAFVILHLQKIVLNPESNVSVANLVKTFGSSVVGVSGPNIQITDKMNQRKTQITLLEFFITTPSVFWVSQINLPFGVSVS